VSRVAPTPVEPLTAPPLRTSMMDVYSQFGEDGIVEEIFRRLGVDVTARQPLWCVEFGAWDGVHLSNTRKLIEQAGAGAVLIEADPERFRALERNCAGIDGVTTLHRTVGWKGDDRLDAILAETRCPTRYDLLSIDVDGHDYRIWERTEDYRATVVIIEFNPTMPFDAVLVPPDDPRRRHGCSLGAIAQLAQDKGYRLVAVTEVNAILVTAERVDELGLTDTSIAALTEDLTDFTTYLYQTFDGELRIGGTRLLMWHQVPFDERVVQALPWFLRTHPEGLGPLRRFALRLLQRVRRRRHERWLARTKTPPVRTP
jgi:hypothetical protein